MPTYDYICSSCGHAMEVVHSVHGHGPAGCPECGGAMRKAFAPPTVVFKGTGWARKERSGGRTAKASTEPKAEEKPAETAPASTPKASSDTD